MSLVNYEHDPLYADTRLGGTVVMTKTKEPVLVRRVRSNSKVVVVKLLNYVNKYIDEVDGINLQLSDLDMSIPKLGYGHDFESDKVEFFVRNPTRHYKHGLNQTNTKGFSYFTCGAFLNCLTNNFLPKVEVFSRAVKNNFFVPFNHNWAVWGSQGKQPSLYYKGTGVGRVDMNMDNGVIDLKLSDRYGFLQEVANEELTNEMG